MNTFHRKLTEALRNDPERTGMDQDTGEVYDRAMFKAHQAKSKPQTSDVGDPDAALKQAEAEASSILDSNPQADPQRLATHSFRKQGITNPSNRLVSALINKILSMKRNRASYSTAMAAR